MLSFDNYIAFAHANLIMKCLHGQTSQALCEMVQLLKAFGLSTRNTTAGNCKISYRKTSFGHTSFSIKGAKIWNKLPIELKTEQNHQEFKTKLKKFLKDNQSCGRV